jgi:hypothetical protein
VQRQDCRGIIAATAVRVHSIGRRLKRAAVGVPGPPQADIRSADGRMLRNEIKAIANLVDAEQGATQSDRANQALSFRCIVEVRPGTEQPVVEDAGRFQVVRGGNDVVDAENLRRRLSPANAQRGRPALLMRKIAFKKVRNVIMKMTAEAGFRHKQLV